jgi:hypothetical protein
MRFENRKNTVANVIREVRDHIQQGGEPNRPRGTMVDYNDLEYYFDILDVQLAPTLRDGRPVTITPDSTVGRNIVHLTRSQEEAR